ncbi:hypothetical protein AXG93_4368s2520 [Marchantia polymorpha subsp. ruderalis]|uniref:Uncharacterized protein n=1 Tax=Marchantia polymorpha subsp. ruderalis TaxID=1480154 RepID=A0A176VYB1_MARPO|nr:hypothetical protein AXG93_4368s2520 [Marchantia polymorpha subsp. ruderalis]
MSMYEQMGKVEEAASTYVAAAQYFKKYPSEGAVTCLSRAAMLFEEIGQLSTSARYFQELGDIFEAEGKLSESKEHYRNAADLYLANDSQVLSNQCRTKVAKHAAELERYTEAIPLFEALARDAVTAAASKKTVREMFLYAGLCHLCSVGGNGGVVKEALKRFQAVSLPELVDFGLDDVTWFHNEVANILQYFATAFEKKSRNLYTEVLNTHEVLFRNDPLARLLANRGQKKLKALPARLKTTRQDSEVQQANLDQLGEPMTDTNEEMTQ